MHGYELDEIFYSQGLDPQLGQAMQLPAGEGDDFAAWAAQQLAAGVVSGAIGEAAASIPAGATTPSGWPAAVPVVPSAWNTNVVPATYVVQSGDTFSGLAATYLGDPARWRDIWDEQPQQYRWSHSPDVLAGGELINMPAEAAQNFLKWKRRGATPGELPGDQPAPQPLADKAKKALPWIIGGALVAGVVAYGATKA